MRLSQSYLVGITANRVYFAFSRRQRQRTRILVITTGRPNDLWCVRACVWVRAHARLPSLLKANPESSILALNVAALCGLCRRNSRFETALKTQRQERHQRLCLAQLLSAQPAPPSRRLPRKRNDARHCIINNRIRARAETPNYIDAYRAKPRIV